MQFFINFSLKLMFVAFFFKCSAVATTVNYTVILKKLVENTFYDFNCLNVYIHNTYNIIEQAEIIKKLHQMNFLILLFDKFEVINENCGFIFFTANVHKILYSIETATLNIPIRILYISETNEKILMMYKTLPVIFQDNDVLLVEIDKEYIKINKKTRYDLEITSTTDDIEKPFFHPKCRIPIGVDYKGRSVKVVTFHCPVFSSISKNELVDGVETRIFKEIVKKLNMSTKVLIPKDGKRWGTAYANKTISGGILKYLYTKMADIGFCSLWIEKTKFPYMLMSGYWEILRLKFLIPKPKKVPTSWNSIFKSFSVNLWLMVLVTTVVTSAASFFLKIMRQSSTLYHNLQQGRQLEAHLTQRAKISSAFVTMVGILVMAKNTPKYKDDNVNQRCLFLWWNVFALIITTSYSSSLVSHLTYPQFESMLDSIEKLTKAGYYWGTPYEPPIHHLLNVNNSWHLKFAQRFKFERNRDDRVKRIQAGNYSLFAKCVGEKHFMEVHEVPINILRELRTTRASLNYFMLAFGFRKTLPYATQANRIIRTLVESGITKYWLDRLFENQYSSTTFAKVYEYKTSSSPPSPEDIQLKRLSLQNLYGGFALFIAGTTLSILIFIGERISTIRQLC